MRGKFCRPLVCFLHEDSTLLTCARKPKRRASRVDLRASGLGSDEGTLVLISKLIAISQPYISALRKISKRRNDFTTHFPNQSTPNHRTVCSFGSTPWTMRSASRLSGWVLRPSA
ncbi:hypothetical protein HGRIS_011941 [Hohenbuehelia grisea]|uniref:Uncharacterized protein n=1 Tax=Hohenbuehelia grisea TaxID=104357 RepID=A0ABR3JY21_9AGAR